MRISLEINISAKELIEVVTYDESKVQKTKDTKDWVDLTEKEKEEIKSEAKDMAREFIKKVVEKSHQKGD